MSLYTDYVSERTGDKFVERDYGFAQYRYINEGRSVYIVDIYVTPEYRKKGVASEMADEIVKIARGELCVDLIGSVSPSAKGSTASLAILLAYGMELHSCAADAIWLRKGI